MTNLQQEKSADDNNNVFLEKPNQDVEVDRASADIIINNKKHTNRSPVQKSEKNPEIKKTLQVKEFRYQEKTYNTIINRVQILKVKVNMSDQAIDA